MTLLFTGFNLGSGCDSFLAAYVIPIYGWEAVLAAGGILPLLLPFLCYLPESASFIAAREAPAHKIAAVLNRIGGCFAIPA